ncbi:MAG: aldolase/citrate lyase family protein [Nitrososphaerales archaeon]
MIGLKLKEKFRRKEMVLGVGIEDLASPIIAKLMKRANFDWVHLELEHTQMNYETLFNFINIANSVELPTIVKVPELSRAWVSRVMDFGATGVRLPWTESREEVEKLVKWVKYPPNGIRAVYLGANTDYLDMDVKEYIKRANESTLVFAHVETKKGIENLKDIAKVEDLDVIMVGPYDLSISLGIAGEFENPKLTEAIDKVIEVCERNGKVPGITVDNFSYGRFLIERGMRCLEIATDRGMLLEKAKEVIKQYESLRG